MSEHEKAREALIRQLNALRDNAGDGQDVVDALDAYLGALGLPAPVRVSAEARAALTLAAQPALVTGRDPETGWPTLTARPAPEPPASPPEREDGEALGRVVRQAWIDFWSAHQSATHLRVAKPHWFSPWEELSVADQRVDIAIAQAVLDAARLRAPGAEGEGWREACAHIGIGGIYDEFHDAADAIRQLGQYIHEAEEACGPCEWEGLSLAGRIQELRSSREAENA